MLGDREAEGEGLAASPHSTPTTLQRANTLIPIPKCQNFKKRRNAMAMPGIHRALYSSIVTVIQGHPPHVSVQQSLKTSVMNREVDVPYSY